MKNKQKLEILLVTVVGVLVLFFMVLKVNYLVPMNKDKASEQKKFSYRPQDTKQ